MRRQPTALLLAAVCLAGTGCQSLTPAQHYDRGSSLQYMATRIIERRNGSLTKIYDHTGAFRHYLAAAEQGHEKATLKVAQCYDKGIGVRRNSRAALLWYLKHGGPSLRIAEIYERGGGGTKDYQKALTWYLKLGGIDGRLGAGRVLAEGGHGLAQDLDRAHQQFVEAHQRASDRRLASLQNKATAEIYALDPKRGGPERKFDTGMSHLFGPKYRGRAMRQSRVDHALAIQWFLKAAKLGHRQAMHNLGALYLTPKGAPGAELRNPQEGLRWLRRAADARHPRSSFRVAAAFARVGNPGLAEKYYRISADQGDPEAQEGLARLLWNPDKPRSDAANQEALELYTKSALAGRIQGQLGAAKILEHGTHPVIGKTRLADAIEAYAWFSIAEGDPAKTKVGLRKTAQYRRKRLEIVLDSGGLKRGELRAEALKKRIRPKRLMKGMRWK